jgi:hypothetical protein
MTRFWYTLKNLDLIGERTWESKRSKYIQVLGVEDKPQITMEV